MTQFIKTSQMSHWYDNQGNPKYEATKKQAREENYFPSVTTITKMLDKPGLNTWKQNMLLECAFTLPKIKGESTNDFINRVVLDHKQATIEAAELGSLFHDQIENYIKGNIEVIHVDGYAQTCVDLMSYIEHELDGASNVVCEQTIVGDGYAGRVDLLYKKNNIWYILDWKTQNVKKLNKNGTLSITKYPEWLWQLEGYAQACKTVDGEVPIIKNIVVSTNKQSQGIREVAYSPEQREKAWEIFKTMRDLWRLINDF